MDAALPLVLIPGTSCDARLFGPMLAHLEVKAVHAAPIASGDLATAAEMVLADAPDRFVAVGFSLGGFVAIELLSKAPERVAAVILIAGNALAMPPANVAGRRAELAHVQTEDDLAGVIEAGWPRYVAVAAQGDGMLRAMLSEMARETGVERFVAQGELAIGRPDLRSVIAAAGVPLLVLCGDEDGLCPLENYRATDAASPRSTLIVLDGVGHFPPLEAPERTAAAIRDWLKEEALCC